jgi:hypothetical protein
MKYLTFLDYPTVQAVGKSFEAQLQGVLKENEELKQRMATLRAQLDQLIRPGELAEIRKQIDELHKKIGL